MLSNLITLTPGTVVLGVSDDRTKIYIHAIDFSTKEQEVESIKTSLENCKRGGRNIMNHNVIIVIALIIVVISMLAMLIRVVLGPSLADRVVALDAIGLQLMAVIALFSILLNIKYMIVVIMMIGILAFLGTAVFSKFMDKGKVIEHDQNHTD